MRLRKRGQFLELQRSGRTRGRGLFVVVTRPRSGDVSRLGITASRKVGPAVVRNRIKRMLREYFRMHHHLIQPAQDVVVIARTDAARATPADVAAELGRALKIS